MAMIYIVLKIDPLETPTDLSEDPLYNGHIDKTEALIGSLIMARVDQILQKRPLLTCKSALLTY